MRTETEPISLLSTLMQREPGAFEELVLAYQDRLYNFVLRYTGNPQDAEEVVQDTFVKAHRALFGRLTPERVLRLALTPWLYRIALNTARNHARRKRLPLAPLAVNGDEADERVEPAAAGDDPAGAAEAAGARAAIVVELLRLSERYRTAVILRLVEGLSYAEIASVTGQPIGTVKSNVHRGVLLMRPGLAPWWRESEEEVSREL